MNPAASVELADVCVRRGAQRALQDVTLSFRPGTLTGLIGPSGSGKSTLMRAVVGVQDHVEGRVTVLGRPAGHPALRRRVSYLTQAPSVYDDLSVRDNVQFFAALLALPPAAALQALRDVGLADLAGRRVAAISGGQRARVALATALLGRPDVLVLDEPTVGLDPVLRADLWALFHRLAARGSTVLVSSHVMDEAARCDRVVLLREGRVLADDTPEGLRRRGGDHDLDTAFLRLVADLAVAP
jgi:ABC-2 type transport system ATP-binding protein